ncbi:MAG: ChuX/HutX family heme-like substrate-binding protein [Pseudomonadota bacterium]
MTPIPAHALSHPETIRERFAAARTKGMRARDAAEHLALSEGAVVAAHTGVHAYPMRAVPLQREWLAILKDLEACGPLMALTRNETTVHEKTGVYQHLSAEGPVGLAVGEDIDLRLFFTHWHAGFVVNETQADGGQSASLQFYDRWGTAVHKVYPRALTNLVAWEQTINRWIDPDLEFRFETGCAPRAARASEEDAQACAEAFAQAWSEMTDTHQFFGLLCKFGLERQQAFSLVEGRFAHRVAPDAVRQMLLAAALDGTPIMMFVGSPGCIQIHTGPVQRVEPMVMRGMTWLNVLDPGFNLHLREDRIAGVWIVEKPGDHGTVTSLEVFDDQGELMAMFFGARKPGRRELDAWRQLLEPLRPASAALA